MPSTGCTIKSVRRPRINDRMQSPRPVLSHVGGHSADCTSGIAILRCVLSLTPAAAPDLPLAAHHIHFPHAMPGAGVRVAP